MLGGVKGLERSEEFDLIVLDAPAAGHAITFLRSASGLADAVKVGPINTQAEEVLELLGDPERCRVVLVTVPEETPVNEVIQTAYSLEDEVGVAPRPGRGQRRARRAPRPGHRPGRPAAEDAGAVLLDGEADVLVASAAFRRARSELQREQLHRMAAELPLASSCTPVAVHLRPRPDDVEVLAAHCSRASQLHRIDQTRCRPVNGPSVSAPDTSSRWSTGAAS